MGSVVKIKDFIINFEDEKIIEEIKTKKNISKPLVEYKLLLENDMDFILKRTSKKTDKDLVILVSQDLFYIKDNVSGISTKLELGNERRLMSAFIRDLQGEIELKENKWISKIDYDYHKILNFMQSDTKKILLKNGITNYYRYDDEKIVKLLKSNNKICRYFNDVFDGVNRTTLLKGACAVDRLINYNNAKYFIDSVKDFGNSSATHSYIHELIEVAKTYNLEINRLIDYVVYDLSSQGISDFDNNILYFYRDYLKMTNDMYGKIDIKYPKNLKTDHDKIMMKYNIYKKYNMDKIMLKISEEQSKLAYSDSNYSILIPKETSEIVSEGADLSHCVASYCEKVVDGETLILFMRDNSCINESLVTIEVYKNRVNQAKGHHNRKVTPEESKFISKWAKKNEIIFNK